MWPKMWKKKKKIYSVDSKSMEKYYELPDGEIIAVGDEQYRCSELLFRPSYTGLSMPGLTDNLYNSIMKCDKEIQKTLYNNLVLGGGTTLLQGFAQRISNDLKEYASPQTNINIIALFNRQYSAWIGGSILACLSTWQKDMYIKKNEYDEIGARVITQKCFL